MEFLRVDKQLKKEWMNYSIWSRAVNEEVIRLENGFSIIAKVDKALAGIISVYYRNLPEPLNFIKEAYIDDMEVRKEFRNRGIATALIEEAILRLDKEVYQIRSWSSIDKVEMLHLWKKLNFTLNPVTIYPNNQEVRGFYVVKCLTAK